MRGEGQGGQRHFREFPSEEIENRAKRSTYMQMSTVSESSFSKGSKHFYGDPLRSSHTTTEHSTKQTKVSETIPPSSSRLFQEEQTRSSDISYRRGDKNSGIVITDTHIRNDGDLTTDRGVKDSGHLNIDRGDRNGGIKNSGILFMERGVESNGLLSMEVVVKDSVIHTTERVVENSGIFSTERGVQNSGILSTERGVEINSDLSTERGVKNSGIITQKRGLKNNYNLSGTKNKKKEEKENEFVTGKPRLND